VQNKEVRQGLILEPRQFALTDGRAVYEASAAKQKLAHPLVDGRVVPAGRKGRFEIAIEAPRRPGAEAAVLGLHKDRRGTGPLSAQGVHAWLTANQSS